jgi:hypothetical protein
VLPLLTPPRNLPALGRRQTLYVGYSPLQSPVFLINSRLSLFSATLSGYRSMHVCTYIPVTLTEHSFSRSYGVNLPSSLTWVLSSA